MKTDILFTKTIVKLHDEGPGRKSLSDEYDQNELERLVEKFESKVRKAGQFLGKTTTKVMVLTI